MRKSTTNLENRLRKEILEELKNVTAVNSPNLYALLQTEEGYREVEAQVIAKVIRDRLVPGAVIPQLEMELTMY